MLEEKFVNHKLDCSLGKWVSFVTAQALSRLMTEVLHSEVHKTFSSGVSMTTVQCLQWIPVNVHFCPSVLDDSGGKGGQIFQRNEISCNLSVTRTHDILCSVDSHFRRKSCKFEKNCYWQTTSRDTHTWGEKARKSQTNRPVSSRARLARLASGHQIRDWRWSSDNHSHTVKHNKTHAGVIVTTEFFYSDRRWSRIYFVELLKLVLLKRCFGFQIIWPP